MTGRLWCRWRGLQRQRPVRPGAPGSCFWPLRGSNTEIASRTAVSRPTVISWRGRYAESGLEGLADRPRSDWPRELDHQAIVSAALVPPPAKFAVTHWSCSRLLAKHLKISFSAVAKAWRRSRPFVWTKTADEILKKASC